MLSTDPQSDGLDAGGSTLLLNFHPDPASSRANAALAAAGRALYSLEVLLRPLEATAHRCGLSWSRPFLLYRAGRLTAAELAEAGKAFAARVRALGSARAPITPHARPRALHPSPA